jgi:4-carboxymuconolactone decarboxylase
VPGNPASDPAATWRRRHARFFARPGLARRTRHGAALAALTAVGDWDGFAAQAAWAIVDRCPLPWLREATLQSYLFVGYPRAITALQILTRQTHSRSDRRFWTEKEDRWPWLPRGRNLCRKIYGRHYEPLLKAMHQTHPELADWMIREGYGKVLARPFLGARVRELCVIPILAAQESWPQLDSHLRGALRVGARPLEVTEAIETGLRMAPDADKTRARSAVRRALG